jgi:hypothetical protein
VTRLRARITSLLRESSFGLWIKFPAQRVRTLIRMLKCQTSGSILVLRTFALKANDFSMSYENATSLQLVSSSVSVSFLRRLVFLALFHTS